MVHRDQRQKGQQRLSHFFKCVLTRVEEGGGLISLRRSVLPLTVRGEPVPIALTTDQRFMPQTGTGDWRWFSQIFSATSSKPVEAAAKNKK